MPPFREVADDYNTKRQVWDGIGVVTKGEDPISVKENYLLGNGITGKLPILLYLADSKGVITAFVVLGQEHQEPTHYILSPQGIDLIVGKSQKKPSEEEVGIVKQAIDGFGVLEYEVATAIYTPEVIPNGKNSMTTVMIKRKIGISSQIDVMIQEYLQNLQER